VVEHFGLRAHIRFNAEITLAAFDPARAIWGLTFANGETAEAKAVVSAVGQLNRPFVPDIKGADQFRGPMFHTAQWDSSVDLKGKRVAIIGTGASAMQTGPSIAPEVERLLVFPRTRHWVAYNPNYHKEVTQGQKWAIAHAPYFGKWMRFQLFWAGSDGFHETLKVDPNWTQPDTSLNEANWNMRQMVIEHIRSELDGDEALLAKVVPPYPPYGKRMLRDNYWYRMLKRPNVDLVIEGIEHIEADTIVTRDGARHPVDVIIVATGSPPRRCCGRWTSRAVMGRRSAACGAMTIPARIWVLPCRGFRTCSWRMGRTPISRMGEASFSIASARSGM
jgi:4-hydroxyacetophenone monooxygenase